MNNKKIRFLLLDKSDRRYISIPENPDGMEIMYSKSEKTHEITEAFVFTWLASQSYETLLSSVVEADVITTLIRVLNPSLFLEETDFEIFKGRFEFIWLLN